MYPSMLQRRAPPESPLHRVLEPGMRPPYAGIAAQNSFPSGATFSSYPILEKYYKMRSYFTSGKFEQSSFHLRRAFLDPEDF